MKFLQIKSLPKGWCDKDEMLVHACFQLLVDYIEKEEAFKVCNWKYTPEHYRVYKELKALYRWWTVTRPKRTWNASKLAKKDIPEKIFEGFKDKNKWAKWHKALQKDSLLERKWEQEDTDNMIRLAKIRLFMWT